MFLGKTIIDERNIGGADMWVAGRGWCNPGADRAGDGSHIVVLLSMSVRRAYTKPKAACHLCGAISVARDKVCLAETFEQA